MTIHKSKRVFFGVPSYRGLWCPQFADSLEATVNLCTDRGHTPMFSLLTGNCYVQAARNELVAKFMESGADVLFFLDDDVSWKADDALRLIEMTDEGVAGIYPKKGEPQDYPVVIHTQPETHYPVVRPDGCISASGLPTGFLRITRSVIEQLQGAYPGQRYTVYEDGEPVGEKYDLFPQGVHAGRWYGEDFAFCNLWTGMEGEMWVVPDIDLVHHSQDKQYPGNYHRFLMEQPR